MILAGRSIKDKMGTYIAQEIMKLMTIKNINIAESKALILGLAFKENCPDIRNTRVIDILEELKLHKVDVPVYDPVVNFDDVRKEFGLELLKDLPSEQYDSTIIAVGHSEFIKMGPDRIARFGKSPCVIYDVKSLLGINKSDSRL